MAPAFMPAKGRGAHLLEQGREDHGSNDTRCKPEGRQRHVSQFVWRKADAVMTFTARTSMRQQVPTAWARCICFANKAGLRLQKKRVCSHGRHCSDQSSQAQWSKNRGEVVEHAQQTTQQVSTPCDFPNCQRKSVSWAGGAEVRRQSRQHLVHGAAGVG
jgi:hypothetical protein